MSLSPLQTQTEKCCRLEKVLFPSRLLLCIPKAKNTIVVANEMKAIWLITVIDLPINPSLSMEFNIWYVGVEAFYISLIIEY